MAVVVFDADVLVAYLARHDAHHSDAVERVRRALESGTRRLVSAVNYAEVLVGPLGALGPAGADTVDAMFVQFGIETIQIDMDLARRAAAVRVQANLKLSDAFALATAVHAQTRWHDDVRLETFDKKVNRAFADLHPQP